MRAVKSPGRRTELNALAGLRVVDLSTLMAAPQVSALLADFGADVVKVEPPGGDPLRRLGVVRGDRSVPYALATRGKRITEIDLDSTDGRELATQLVDAADVVVVNQPRQLLKRWQLTYEQLAARNPRLVYVSVTCYGGDGPYADLPGNGSLAEAFAGLTHLTGAPGGPPVLPSAPLGDPLVALSGVIGTLLACYARDVGGAPGQRVDVSMYEPVLGLLALPVAAWDGVSAPPTRTGSRVQGGVPRNVYRTADDRWVVLSGTTDAQVARVLDVIGIAGPDATERYGTSAARLAVADELDARVADWISRRSRQEAVAAFRAARVPISPVNDFADLVADPHIAARDSFTRLQDDDLGAVTVPAPTPKLSATPGGIGGLGGGSQASVHVQDVIAQWQRAGR
jgi:crotonobetainyl-CoA:carnitine CoA-transferase CaiB-like acyl-CoA transferase